MKCTGKIPSTSFKIWANSQLFTSSIMDACK
jgi:hypothetical protein